MSKHHFFPLHQFIQTIFWLVLIRKIFVKSRVQLWKNQMRCELKSKAKYISTQQSEQRWNSQKKCHTYASCMSLSVYVFCSSTFGLLWLRILVEKRAISTLTTISDHIHFHLLFRRFSTGFTLKNLFSNFMCYSHRLCFYIFSVVAVVPHFQFCFFNVWILVPFFYSK